MMTQEIKKIIKIFFIVDIGIVIFTLLENNYIWLLNTQIAFFSSFFVTITSYLSYSKYVLKNLDNAIKNRDTIDKIDDPFDLYDEDQTQEEQLSDTKTEKEILEEEKQKIKKKGLKDFKSFGAFLSIYKLLSYLFLISGFFYLNNNHLLHTLSYLFGLFLIPFSLIILKILKIIK